MKQWMLISTLAVFSVALAADGIQSGVRGAGVVKTAEGTKVEVKMHLANVEKNGKTAVFGELEAFTVNKTDKTETTLYVSPLNNKVPVKGTLTVSGSTATLNAKARLVIRSRSTVKKFEGDVVVTIVDSVSAGKDTLSLNFTSAAGATSFSGTVERGNLIVWTGAPKP